MFSKVQLIGRLGADPEMRFTPSGKAVTNLRVAALELSAEDVDRLLDLAGHAAHDSEARTNAPLLCYLIGVARTVGTPTISIGQFSASVIAPRIRSC